MELQNAKRTKVKELVRVGSVVQIDPDTQLGEKQGFFACCLMIVTEVRQWGCQGYFYAPEGPRGEMPKQAYYRASWDEIVYVGESEWMRA